MFITLTIIPHYFPLLVVLLSSFCVEGVGASPVPFRWGTGGGLVRRVTVGESTPTSGMSRQVAQGLSFALIILAVLIGLAVLVHRSRVWHRQRHAALGPVPSFLANRPTAGSIPVIMSPRTADIVANNPSVYGTPTSDHAMPHWTGHFHLQPPPAPPPPAYSVAIGSANGIAVPRV